MFTVDIVYSGSKSNLVHDESHIVSEQELHDMMKVLNNNYTKLYTVESDDSVVIGFRKGDNRCDITIKKE